ncbi:Efflux pump, partial [Hyphodiscus hymeniophilus]
MSDEVALEHKSNDNDGTMKEKAAPAAMEAEQEYITGVKLFLVTSACTMAGFLMLLDTSIIATAIPRITSDFHSIGDIGWYGTAYQLANCAFQPLTGKTYNQFSSKKYTFIVFLAVFELGSLLSGVAQSSNMLIAGRAVAGIGGSGLLNGGLTIVRSCVPSEENAKYLGILLGIVQLGIMTVPILGGALTQYTTWRWCFYINLPPGGLVAIALIFVPIPGRRPKREIKTGLRAILQSFDLPGFAIFAGAAIQFLLAIEWGGAKYRWGSSVIIGLFCGFAVTLLVFGLWEHRRGNIAMFPLSMLRQRIVWTSCATYFFINGNMIVTSFYMSIYFQAVRGESPTLSGVHLLPSVLGQMVLAIACGILVGRLGYYLPFAIGSGALAAVGTGLLTTVDAHTSTEKWMFYQIIAGVGRGMGLQMPIVAVQNLLRHELQTIGLAATIFQNSLSTNIHKYAPDVNVQAVLGAGVTGFRQLLSPASLPSVTHAYVKSVDNVFYLITSAALVAFITAWGMGWKSVKTAEVASE